jgi:creatinine amidohydrolase
MVKTTANERRGLLVAEVSWDVIDLALAGGAVAVLPIGAAAKEHGRHLPMNADWLLAEWLAQRFAERLPVVVWPTLAYGYYPAFTDYPGSVSLRAATFRALIEDIASSIFCSGAASLVVVNCGFRPKPAPNSGACRHPIPDHAGGYSGPCRQGQC